MKHSVLMATAAAAVLSMTTSAHAQPVCPIDDDRPELRIAMPALWADHDGIQNSNFAARVNQSLYDRIVERDWLSRPDGTGTGFRPGIATSWERLSDTEWELTIREDVTFHDGTPLTAEDVAFTISAERGEIAPRANRYNVVIEAIDVIDDHTLRITTTRPDVVFLWRLASPLGAVVPRDHYLEQGPEFGNHPIATGPYAWVEKVDGEYLQLVANDEYWGERPPLRCITYFEVPENSTRVAGLISGQFDMITSVPLELARIIDETEGFGTQVSVVENTHQIALTSNNPALAVNDRRVRQAMVYALDRQAMVDSLWGGLNWVKSLSWREYGEFHNPEPPRAYDPERARALLEEAGYDGQPIEFRVVAGYYVNLDRAIQIMEEQWRAVGLNVDVVRVENWAQIGSIEDRLGYDGFFVSLNLEYIDPVYELVDNYGNPDSTRGQSWDPPSAYYDHAEVLATSYDDAARMAAYEAMYDIWMEETPAIFLYRPLEVWGVRDGVDWINYGMYWMDFRDGVIAVDAEG